MIMYVYPEYLEIKRKTFLLHIMFHYAGYIMSAALVTYCSYNNLPQTYWFKTIQIVLFYSYGGQKSIIGPTGLKSRYQKLWVLSGGSRRKSVSCLFQPLKAIHTPTICPHITQYCLLLSSYKLSCLYLRPNPG